MLVYTYRPIIITGSGLCKDLQSRVNNFASQASKQYERKHQGDHMEGAQVTFFDFYPSETLKAF
jgi:hypothetical protein